ncbi:hypothetical protein HMN09_00404400 [Mycena chlorophos]|uniref:Uncharacterized protein n=1 Tax=Mycena chlorophos TaxID=658473 RepID=A0A8H6WJ16_MYCCL|nr:hypothetical protein HMN09_00404400 [Mycena chlorophos]
MDDEVPPSDGEDELVSFPVPIVASRPVTDAISSFTTIPQSKSLNPTNDPIASSSSAMPTAGQRPRPRPKPKLKGMPGAVAPIPAAAMDTSLIESFSEQPNSSLSDRVKMRDRSSSSKKVVDAPSAFSTSSLRGKPSDIIEITDTETSADELAMPSKKKRGVKLVVKTPPKPVSTSSLPPSDPFPESTNNNDLPPPPLPLQDDEMAPPIDVLPPPPSTSPSRSPAPAPKPPKKSRKKKADGDDTNGDKPPKKPRAKKAKKDAETADGAGEGGEKPKKQRKKKDKEKEKVFTSAEFILDSDDEQELPGLPPPLVDSSDDAVKPVSTVSVPDSQAGDELVPVPVPAPVIGEKRKRDDNEDNGDEMGDDEDGPSDSSKKKAAKKAKVASDGAPKSKKAAGGRKGKANVRGKKRPLAVLSDDEDDAEVQLDEPPVPPSPQAPKPTSKSKQPAKKKAKKAFGSESEDVGDEEPAPRPKPTKKKAKKSVASDSEDAENKEPAREPSPPPEPNTTSSQNLGENAKQPPNQLIGTPKPINTVAKYALGARSKSLNTPLSQLINKVNSLPNSPFPAVGGGGGRAFYSPYAKFSKRALSNIAPLHPNRRTPPPPPPPPAPKPKTKKEKEMEERWEEEMIEAVGGWEEWQKLGEDEQKAARRAKRQRELEGWDD